MESRVPPSVAAHSAPPGQERLSHADGHELLVVTDKSWTSDPGPVTADDLHSSQDIDADMRTTPGCAPDSRTRAASTPSTYDNARLAPDPAPPVQSIAHLHPQWT